MKFSFAFFFLLTTFCCEKIYSAGNEWQKIEAFAGIKRERSVAFSIGSRGYVSCGQDSANQMKRDFWEYDPGTNSWTQKANFGGIGRRDAVGFAIGNKGYIGTGISTAVSSFGIRLSDLWEYDPTINTWIQKASYPGNSGTGIYYATAFVVGGKGYVACGKKGASFYSDELWEFDPVLNFWTQKSFYPGGVRYGATSFAVNGKGYVGTGADENAFTNDFWSYDPGSDIWSAITSLPGSPRFSCTGFSIDTLGYIVLGTDGGYKDELWEYNPAIDYWNVRNPYNGDERRSAVGFVIGDKAYVGTGKGSGGCKRDMYVYTPWTPDGIDENFFDGNNTFAFPNPMTESSRISLKPGSVSSSQNVTVNFYDIDGRYVRTIFSKGAKEIKFNRESLVAGTYLYEVYTESSKIGYGKLIVL